MPRKSFRLEIELVPASCWYRNIRAMVSKETWDQIRRAAYARANYRCEICGARGVLHCHERWHYDDQRHIQRLDGFIALCVWCHHVKHIGLAGILADRGELDFERVVAHFLRVNRCSRAEFERHYEEAFQIWEERSAHEWAIDLGPYAELIKNRPPE